MNISNIYKSAYCKLDDFLKVYREKSISEDEILDCTYLSKIFRAKLKDTNKSVSIEKHDAIVCEEDVKNAFLRIIEQSYYVKLLKKTISYRYEIVIPHKSNQKELFDDIRCYVGNYPTRRYGSYLIKD